MNKNKYMTAHDFFRSISQNGCDGRTYKSNDALFIDKYNDVWTVFNEWMRVLFIMFECFYCMGAQLNFFRCGYHVLSPRLSYNVYFFKNYSIFALLKQRQQYFNWKDVSCKMASTSKEPIPASSCIISIALLVCSSWRYGICVSWKRYCLYHGQEEISVSQEDLKSLKKDQKYYSPFDGIREQREENRREAAHYKTDV